MVWPEQLGGINGVSAIVAFDYSGFQEFPIPFQIFDWGRPRLFAQEIMSRLRIACGEYVQAMAALLIRYC